MRFDPDAAAKPGSGVFGLPESRADAGILLLPVPFDATTSYGGGAAAGPDSIRRASAQIDLHDLQFGRVFETGIFMEDESSEIRELSRMARSLAAPIIEKGGAEPEDAEAVARIDQAGDRVNAFVHDWTRAVLRDGKIPGIVGGDHSTPFGAIRACAEAIVALPARHAARLGPPSPAPGLGVLQIDAHMDLRDRFEGFQWSHASIMHNVLEQIPGVERLVQIGLRDVGEGELELMRRSEDRVNSHFDYEWSRRLEAGERFSKLCDEALVSLPRDVYISFDIDGLDPSLCPHTGTPVPGGLTFNRACMLLESLWKSGRRVVGFDLNEVCPGPGPDPADEWDANVGARILYKLCGVAASRR